MRPNIRRVIPIVIIFGLLAAAIWYFWDTAAQQENGPLTASGTIEADKVILASEGGGKVMAVLADEGDSVSEGQVLVEFDDTILQAQLDQAKAALAQAKANYDLVARGLPEDQQQLAIANANLELLSAKQALDDLYDTAELQGSFAMQEIARADKAIDQAQKRIDTLNSPADQADINEAKASMILARDQLDKAEDKFEPYEKKKEDNVIRAALLRRVAEAQNYYDKTVTRYNNLIGTANELDLAVAESDLIMAEAQKADAERRAANLSSGPDPADVNLVEARIETARANLNAAMAKPSSEELAVAHAQIDAAESTIHLLDAQIEQLVLKSMIDGVVLERVIEPGEVAAPGSPLFALAQIDDLTITVFVSEDRYGEIMLGQPVQVRVDSYPGEIFPGIVIHIADEAEYTPRNVQTQEGRRSTVFAIKIKIDNPAGKLKPGMPADITFNQG